MSEERASGRGRVKDGFLKKNSVSIRKHREQTTEERPCWHEFGEEMKSRAAGTGSVSVDSSEKRQREKREEDLHRARSAALWT